MHAFTAALQSICFAGVNSETPALGSVEDFQNQLGKSPLRTALAGDHSTPAALSCAGSLPVSQAKNIL